MKKILVVMNLNMKRLDSWIEFNRAFVKEGGSRGYSIEYLLPSEPCEEVKKFFDGSGFKAHVFTGWNSSSGKQHDLKLGFKCWQLMRQENHNLVTFHFCDEISVLFFIFLSFMTLKLPQIVWHQHSNITALPPGSGLKKALSKLRILSLLVDHVCPVFEKQKQILIGRGIKPKRITAIYNGISPQRFQTEFDHTAYRKSLNLNDNHKVIITIGSLIERKRIDLFIKAAADVVKKDKDTIFLIVGEGELLKSLEKLVTDLDLNNHVHFLGRRSDVDKLLRISDIYVLCSSAEGFPLSNIEACASKTLVISTDVSGVSELIKDGETGFLIKPGDAQELSEKILLALQNPLKAKEIAAEGQRVVFERFTLEKMVHTYFVLYWKLLK